MAFATHVIKGELYSFNSAQVFRALIIKPLAMRTSARRQTPADVITYRYNDQMMYVPPAESFDQAVTFARSAFESDLTGIDKSRISFSLNVLANGKQSSVGISRVAWSKMMAHLARYEIIDVHVQPEIKVSAPPPSYQPCSPTEGNEKKQHSSSRSSVLHNFVPKRLFQRLSA